MKVGTNYNNYPILDISNGKEGFIISINEAGRFFTFSFDFNKIFKSLNTFVIGIGHRNFTLFWFQYVGFKQNRFILDIMNKSFL